MFFQVVVYSDDSAGDRSRADFAPAFAGRHMDPEEAAINGFDFGGGAHHGVDADRNAMLNLDGSADRDFAESQNGCRA